MIDMGVTDDATAVDFAALKQRCLDNVALVNRVLGKFATQLDSDLMELEKALEAEDSTAFAMLAHRVKGMSANIEARRLCRWAARGEERARQQQLVDMRTCLTEMQLERDRISEALACVSL